MSHDASLSSAEKARASRRENARRYRQHRRDAGVEDVLFQLPGSVIAVIDAFKECHGLPNRSQALLQLIEEKGAEAQQNTA